MIQFRSPLIWRLILWFLLLSLIPIGIVLVFVQRQVRDTAVEQQIQGLRDEARLLSLQVTNQPERAQKIVEEFSFGDQIAFLLDEDGTYVAHPDSSKVGLSATVDFGADILQNLLAEQFTGINNSGNNQYIGSAKVENTQYVATVTMNSEASVKTVDDLSSGIILQLVVSLLITSLAGGTAIFIVLGPIIQIANFADRLGAGELDAEFDATDLEGELAILARSLNNLAVRVRTSIATLEQRVAERTADLNFARIQSEERARDLQSISEISQIVSSEQRLEILLPLIVRLVSEKFKFYHSGIFLMDESRRYALLQAANSEGGQRMLNRGHRLEVGIGIVGNVASTGKPRIALDVGTDAVFFDNPDLPATRSEMALPLNVRGVTIGVLDVQSTKAGEFTENELNMLGILADQIAIAIENARLFAKTQQTLNEVQTLYSQYLQKEWKAFQSKSVNVGYQQSGAGGKHIESPLESDEIRKALQQGEIIIGEHNGSQTEPAMVVPIKLRDETIGVLNIKAPVKDHKWSRDEINLIQSVSERLALALENARLFEETNRRAERERLVSEITGKIRSVNDPQAMIQTAMEELRNVLGASRVQVIPQAPQKDQ